MRFFKVYGKLTLKTLIFYIKLYQYEAQNWLNDCLWKILIMGILSKGPKWVSQRIDQMIFFDLHEVTRAFRGWKLWTKFLFWDLWGKRFFKIYVELKHCILLIFCMKLQQHNGLKLFIFCLFLFIIIFFVKIFLNSSKLFLLFLFFLALSSLNYLK